MTVWHTTTRRPASWPAKAVIALGLLAVLLVAAVPVALFTGVILMLLGHVIGGLVLIGASILAATAAIAAVVIAGWSGVRQLRKLVSEQRYRVVQLRRGEYYYD